MASLEDVRGRVKDKRIAIVGAGWTGLQCAQTLREVYGMKHVVLYEKASTFGGTWNPQHVYPQLRAHASALHLEFSGHLFSGNRDRRPSAKEVYEYFQDFVARTDLKKILRTNHAVRKIHYLSKPRRQAMLEIDVKREEEEEESGMRRSTTTTTMKEGPFDFVLFASYSSVPTIPKSIQILNDFHGIVVHSGHVRQDLIDKIFEENLKVLIVGGSKSATDMYLLLQEYATKTNNVQWLYRTPYWFLKFELLFHNRSLLRKLHACLTVLSLLLFGISSAAGIWSLWMIGLARRMPGPAHFDGTKFRFGILDRDQELFLQAASPIVSDEPVKLTGGNQVLLKSGDVLVADVVIFATGYDSGFSQLDVTKDGVPFALKDKPLYKHFVVPEVPCLGAAASFLVNFGSRRGLSCAEFLVHQLVSSSKSETEMRRVANGHWSRSSALRGFVFRSDTSFVTEMVRLFFDLWWWGHIRVVDGVYFWGRYFIHVRTTTPKFDFSPKLKVVPENY